MKKEDYFNSKNIDIKSRKWLELVTRKKIRSLRKNISIENASLLVIDMQKYFTSPSSHAYVRSVEPVIYRINKVIDIFYRNKRPVIYTRHTDKPSKNNSLLKWWKDKILENNKLSKLDERVYRKDAKIIKKSQYDAFYNTELEKILKGDNIKKVFICGVVANLCCETTARSAFVRGYDVYFGIDLTAAYNEMHHLSTIINISYGFGVPFLVKDLE